MLEATKAGIEARVAVDVFGCWIWQRGKSKNGYGLIQIGSRAGGHRRRTLYAHRVSYEVFAGPIPVGLELDHLCRNRACVNPAHLEPVTRSINTLRGAGPAKLGALNGRKTHCKNGHPFDLANTRYRPTGGRSCRACARKKG